MLKVQCISPISRECRKAVRETVKALPDHIDFQHDVLIEIHPLEHLQDRQFGACDGLFIPYWIRVAGKKRKSESSSNFERRIRMTVIHECIHYIQYRDNATTWEEGVGLITANMYRAIFGD